MGTKHFDHEPSTILAIPTQLIGSQGPVWPHKPQKSKLADDRLLQHCRPEIASVQMPECFTQAAAIYMLHN